MRAVVNADYGRTVVVESGPANGDIKVTTCPQEKSSYVAIQVVLNREGALALAALLTVAAKEVKR